MDLYKDGNIPNNFTINYKLECERYDNTVELNLYDKDIYKQVQHYIMSLHKLMDKTILSKLTKDELLNLQELINDVLREKR